MYHAIFLLFVGMTTFATDAQKKVVFIFTLIGVLFFSGSIYLLNTAQYSGIPKKFLGPITPIGGLLLVFSWIYLFYCIIAKK